MKVGMTLMGAASFTLVAAAIAALVGAPLDNVAAMVVAAFSIGGAGAAALAFVGIPGGEE